MSGTNKLAAEKNQRILLELVNQPGNDTCADCKARTPRWASHNLGIFICVNCASIHRKMGTHISKVKSLTLDTWTKEQVEHMKQLGNVKCNAKYNPDEKRHPPPTNMIDSERDSELEKFIRAKYEFRSFMQRTSERSSEPLPKVSALAPSSSIDRSAAVAALLGPSRSASSRTSPVAGARPSNTTASSSTAKALPKSAPPASMSLPSVSQPASALALPPRPQDRPGSQLLTTSASAGALGQTSFGGTLANGQPHTVDATLPLQVLAPGSAPLAIPSATPTSSLAAPNPFHNLQGSSAPAFQSSFGQMTGVSPGSVGSGLGVSPSMSTGMSSSFSGTNLSPYHSSPIGGATLSSTPSPNPFSPQALPNATAVNAISVQNAMSGFSHQQQTPFGQSAATPYTQTSQTPFGQPQTPFGQPNQSPFAQPNQSPFGQPAQPPFSQPSFPGQQQFSQHPQAPSFAQPQQMQYAQPQPQAHAPAPGNPYLQTPSPFMGAQHVGGSPSPYAQAQPLPQMNAMQQPQQTGFGGTNPFTSWVQQPPQQQGGYGQQWSM